MQCNWDEAWVGICKNKTEAGPFCDKHKGKRCAICGKEATHSCDHTSAFVCGEPLCNGCNHDSNRNTQCSGCKKHPSVCMCKGTSVVELIQEVKEQKAQVVKKTIAQRMREQTNSATEWIRSNGYKEVVKVALKQVDDVSSNGGYKTIVSHPYLNFYDVATQVVKELQIEGFFAGIQPQEGGLQEQLAIYLSW